MIRRPPRSTLSPTRRSSDLITVAQRAEYRGIIASEGLSFAGLHWLMVSPKGLHVTGPDAGLRRRSWGHIRGLMDLCAGLGPDGVMVSVRPSSERPPAD